MIGFCTIFSVFPLFILKDDSSKELLEAAEWISYVKLNDPDDLCIKIAQDIYTLEKFHYFVYNKFI